MGSGYHAFVEQGRQAVAEGRLDEAIAVLRAATVLRPAARDARLDLALALRAAGRIEAARMEFLRVAESGPGGGSARARAALDELPPPPAQRADFQIGQRLQSERQRTYEVLNVLAGGFGVVYIVRIVGRTGGRLALKTFHAGLLWSDEDRRRFEREAATWISLSPHPNIVSAGSVERIQGFPCLELEYVGGGDLGSVLAAGPLHLDHAVRLAFQFCDGMDHAHRQLGLVHRDVKPANCLLTADGVLKVTDFGLARAFDQVAGRAAGPDGGGTPAARADVRAAGLLTTLSGTPAYMAPEQFRPGEQLDTRADIYAFGVMLHQMLSGERPAPGAPPTWRPARRRRAARLARLIESCIAPRRADRPATFADVRRELGRAFTAPAAAVVATTDARTLRERAIGQYQLGKNTEALATADEGLRVAGDDPVVRGHLWQVRGIALKNLGRYDEALASHAESLELNPREYTAWVGRADALEKLGLFEEALTCHDRAVELAPDQGLAWMARASCLLHLGRYEEGLRCCERAATTIPHHEKLLYYWAALLRQVDRHDEALETIDRLLGIAPRNDWGWTEKANILNAVDRPADALASADRAAEIAPQSITMLYARAMALERLGRLDDALAGYDRIVEAAPDDPEAWSRRGLALAALDRADRALDSFAHALDLAPDHAGLWCNQGVLLEAAGRPDEALRSYRRATELDADDPHSWLCRGTLLEDLGRLPEALDSLERAVRLRPADTTAAEARDRVRDRL